MLKSFLVAAGLFVAALSVSSAPASAVPLGHASAAAAATEASPLATNVQYYGYGRPRYYGGRRAFGPRRFGPRPFVGRRYGYGRPYGYRRGYGGYGPRPFYRGGYY